MQTLGHARRATFKSMESMLYAALRKYFHGGNIPRRSSSSRSAAVRFAQVPQLRRDAGLPITCQPTQFAQRHPRGVFPGRQHDVAQYFALRRRHRCAPCSSLDFSPSLRLPSCAHSARTGNPSHASDCSAFSGSGSPAPTELPSGPPRGLTELPPRVCEAFLPLTASQRPGNSVCRLPVIPCRVTNFLG
jgi:hypothetical protein